MLNTAKKPFRSIITGVKYEEVEMRLEDMLKRGYRQVTEILPEVNICVQTRKQLHSGRKKAPVMNMETKFRVVVEKIN